MKNRDQKNILKFWEAMLFRCSFRDGLVPNLQEQSMILSF
jgi:hypothetical protein